MIVDSVISLDGEFTIVAWINPDFIPQTEWNFWPIIGWSGGLFDDSFSLMLTQTGIQVSTAIPDPENEQPYNFTHHATTTINVDESSFITLTRNGDNLLKLYHNGSEISFDGGAKTESQILKFGLIGGHSIDNDDQYFNGLIDEVAVISSALTQSEMVDIYDGGTVTSTYDLTKLSPTHWWRMGDTSADPPTSPTQTDVDPDLRTIIPDEGGGLNNLIFNDNPVHSYGEGVRIVSYNTFNKQTLPGIELVSVEDLGNQTAKLTVTKTGNVTNWAYKVLGQTSMNTEFATGDSTITDSSFFTSPGEYIFIVWGVDSENIQITSQRQLVQTIN